MKKDKIILIGAINKGSIATCGETMKNQLFVKRFDELFDKVITVDTFNWTKRPWVLVKLLLTLIFNKGAKVIISASQSASYLISFLYYIPLKKDVYFWVVGGNLVDRIKKGFYNWCAMKNLKYIIVQGKKMVHEMNELGFYNVLYVPNSKPIIFKPTIEYKIDKEVTRFVFLSRIHPDKGIGEILESVKFLNENGYSKKIIVDFYGKIDNSYEDKFISQISNINNVTYKGFLDLTDNVGYETLSSYDMMLFPTYWNGEGFPGVVIDAYIAGIPIVASDWNLNKEVVEDGVTGYIIPPRNSQILAEIMTKIVENKEDLNYLKQNCIESSKKYDFRNVLSIELMKNLGLI